MSILLLLGGVSASTAVNFLSKQYGEKTKAFNLWLFSGMTMLGGLLFFFLQSGFQFRFVKEILPITVLFTLGYAATMVGSVFALQKGPFSVTTLIHSYSLFPPVLFYLIVLNEKISAAAYIGIALVFLSVLFLREKNVVGSFSRAWLFWVTVSFVGNSICAIMMKMQQVLYGGVYKNEMMMYALFVLTILFFILGMPRKGRAIKEMASAALYGLPRGALNGISTFLGLILLEMLPAAICGPLSAGGNIVAAFLLSVLYYREKLSKSQLFGYLLGTMSVILLNI